MGYSFKLFSLLSPPHLYLAPERCREGTLSTSEPGSDRVLNRYQLRALAGTRLLLLLLLLPTTCNDEWQCRAVHVSAPSYLVVPFSYGLSPFVRKGHPDELDLPLSLLLARDGLIFGRFLLRVSVATPDGPGVEAPPVPDCPGVSTQMTRPLHEPRAYLEYKSSGSASSSRFSILRWEGDLMDLVKTVLEPKFE